MNKFTLAALRVLPLVLCFATLAGADENSKTFAIDLEPVGFQQFTLSQGVALDYYINSDSMVSLEYLPVLTSLARLSDLSGDNALVEGNSIGLNYRYFLGSSFYVKGGLLYRTVHWSTAQDSNGYTSDYVRFFEGSALALEGAIGNRWNYNWISVGVDWIGYVKPISTKTYSNFGAKDSDIGTYLGDAQLELLRLSIGISF